MPDFKFCLMALLLVSASAGAAPPAYELPPLPRPEPAPAPAAPEPAIAPAVPEPAIAPAAHRPLMADAKVFHFVAPGSDEDARLGAMAKRLESMAAGFAVLTDANAALEKRVGELEKALFAVIAGKADSKPGEDAVHQ